MRAPALVRYEELNVSRITRGSSCKLCGLFPTTPVLGEFSSMGNATRLVSLEKAMEAVEES
jgi:hypothetical protein